MNKIYNLALCHLENQCTAQIKKTNKQCMRKSLKKSKYCFQHQPPTERQELDLKGRSEDRAEGSVGGIVETGLPQVLCCEPVDKKRKQTSTETTHQPLLTRPNKIQLKEFTPVYDQLPNEAWITKENYFEIKDFIYNLQRQIFTLENKYLTISKDILGFKQFNDSDSYNTPHYKLQSKALLQDQPTDSSKQSEPPNSQSRECTPTSKFEDLLHSVQSVQTQQAQPTPSSHLSPPHIQVQTQAESEMGKIGKKITGRNEVKTALLSELKNKLSKNTPS